MAVTEFKLVKEQKKEDSLHINANRSRIRGYITVLKFIDKDTKQWVCFAPSFDLSSYGETQEKAITMLKGSLVELFKNFVEMPPNQLQAELHQMGWKKNRFRNKDFSRAFVDADGNLNNFNADEDKVERFALVA